MKFAIAPSRAAALVALIASVEAARHGHHHAHRHDLRSENVSIEKRGGQCQFPTDAGLVSVTPNEQNAGWAMSPNQPCKPGNYCPYACPAGQVSMQWDPKATSYSYPMSMVSLRRSPTCHVPQGICICKGNLTDRSYLEWRFVL